MMNKPKYLYKSEPFLKVYEFVSEGPKGQIKKMVQYTDTRTENVYNLAFGDYDEETKSINDLSVTNNGMALPVSSKAKQTLERIRNAYIGLTLE